MSMGELLTDQVAGLILDNLNTQLATRAETEVEVQLRRIEQALSRLEARQADQAAAPLRAAVTYIQLGRFDQALVSLIAAEAVEPASPVARVLLATVLWAHGEHSQALSRMKEAWRLNPYVLPSATWQQVVLPASGLSAQITPEPDPEARQQWRTRFDDPQLWTELPRPLSWNRFFGAWLGGGNDATIARQVVAIGDTAAVSWTRGYQNEVVDRYVSGVETLSGRILWTQRPEGPVGHTWRLQFATPSFVVVGWHAEPWEQGDRPTRLELLRIETGESHRQMSAGYAATSFHPEPIQLEFFSAANVGHHKIGRDREGYKKDSTAVAAPLSSGARWLLIETLTKTSEGGPPWHGTPTYWTEHRAFLEGLR